MATLDEVRKTVMASKKQAVVELNRTVQKKQVPTFAKNASKFCTAMGLKRKDLTTTFSNVFATFDFATPDKKALLSRFLVEAELAQVDLADTSDRTMSQLLADMMRTLGSKLILDLGKAESNQFKDTLDKTLGVSLAKLRMKQEDHEAKISALAAAFETNAELSSGGPSRKSKKSKAQSKAQSNAQSKSQSKAKAKPPPPPVEEESDEESEEDSESESESDSDESVSQSPFRTYRNGAFEPTGKAKSKKA
jgi:hypothetical protein